MSIDSSTNGFLVNSNKVIKNTDALNVFIEPHVFMNKLIRGKKDLEKNAQVITIDARYDFRPDRLAYEYYGQDFWFPAILVVNDIGSMLQFKAECLNFECLIPQMETISNILKANDLEFITPEEAVNKLFI